MTHDRHLYYQILKIVVFMTFMLLAAGVAEAQVWTVLASDPKGDAQDPSLPDAAQLAYRYDKQQDLLWFHLSLYGIPNEQSLGVNIVFDTGGDDAAKMNWWGANKAFKFDKLLTVSASRSDKGYQGTIGIGDVAGVKAKQFANLSQNNLQIQVAGDSILIGVKRTEITNQLKLNLIAAVGSNQQWNDDVPNTGSATIDLAAERPKRGLRELDFTRNNLELPAGYHTLPHEQPPVISKQGEGEQTLILVPGMYSGAESFAGFISRNRSRYKFYVLTPPGINGTPARPTPAKGPRLGELIWTHLLERDLLNLIHREALTKPVMVAEGQPASIAALDLAINHADEIGGVVLVGASPVQFFPSPKDPTRKSPGTLAERIDFIEGGFAPKWFKYVTPETWLSNDVWPELLSNDPSRGQKAWQEIEATPLQINIRYLCEYWASDVTRDFDRLQVPVLALVPAFDEKFLANTTNRLGKGFMVDSWDASVPKNPKLEVLKIQDSRMLVLDDQPKQADAAILRFVEQVASAPQRK